MNSDEMTLVEVMVGRYGPLMGLSELAETLKRPLHGVRMSLARQRDDSTRRLNSSKVRIGRRVYFRTIEVARIFAEYNEAAGF
jgi:hypothetical protein